MYNQAHDGNSSSHSPAYSPLPSPLCGRGNVSIPPKHTTPGVSYECLGGTVPCRCAHSPSAGPLSDHSIRGPTPRSPFLATHAPLDVKNSPSVIPVTPRKRSAAGLTPQSSKQVAL
ncbi:hypothetical protein C8T65DRAFT_642243 [Cerioporus squamosus]|nr:hypothetical protein C8T65DRAFT_642243 [Cerioporus squamosus]